MKKKILNVVFALFVLAVVVCGFFVGGYVANKQTTEKYVDGFSGEVIYPTADFVQGWMLTDFAAEDYENYFTQLKAAGYDTVIFQYVRYESNGATSVFYPTEKLQGAFSGDVYTSNADVLPTFLDNAEKYNFKVFIGLSVADEWWSEKNFANNDFCKRLADIDNVMIEEINDLYGHYDCFYGWYWAYEMLTNIHGYEQVWADMINVNLDFLAQLGDDRPLMFSPFIHKMLRGAEGDTYKMWFNFFQKVKFRKGDIFCPQDSIGKISREEGSYKAYARTIKYLRACKNACDTNENLEFWVNCELFATKNNIDSVNLTTADLDRIKTQYVIASSFADKLVSFSFSHYLLEKGPNNSAEDKALLFDEYVSYVESLK